MMNLFVIIFHPLNGGLSSFSLYLFGNRWQFSGQICPGYLLPRVGPWVKHWKLVRPKFRRCAKIKTTELTTFLSDFFHVLSLLKGLV